jgi:cytochrome c2
MRKPIAAAALLIGLLIAAYGGYWLYRSGDSRAWAMTTTFGDPSRANRLFIANGCTGCHEISGIPGAIGQTGPSLNGISERKYIGGVLLNTPQNLISWIRASRQLDPETAMPSTGVSEQEARDMAAYLYMIN